MNKKSVLFCIVFTISFNLICSIGVVYYIQHYSRMVTTQIDNNWEGWKAEKKSFGFDSEQSQVPYLINAPLQVNGTVISQSTSYWNKRWGFHVFDGFAGDGVSRVSLLIGKHADDNRQVSELYTYTGNSHNADAYGWIRIGSDVQNHSFLFSRDELIANGKVELHNIISLARISPSQDLLDVCNTVEEADDIYNPEKNPEENSKCLLYIALQNAEDGSMYYDSDKMQIMVKISGEWKAMKVSE